MAQKKTVAPRPAPGHRPSYREAVAAALAAFQARTHEPRALLAVARQLEPAGELRAMYACAHDIAVQRDGDPEITYEFGLLLARAGFNADALELFKRVNQAGGHGPGILLHVARALQAIGEPSQAALAYDVVLRMAPGLPPALLGIAETGGGATDDAALAKALREQIRGMDDDPRGAAMLHYALFLVLDRSGKTKAAWSALEQGMALERDDAKPVDPAAADALFDHLPKLRGDAAEVPAGAENAAQAPVFMVGLHARGVAGLGRLLSQHPQVGDIGESFDFVRQLRWCTNASGPPMPDLTLARAADDVDFRELGARYREHTMWRTQGKAVQLDRNPGNFMLLGHIARALPRARFLHVVATPMETCFDAMVTWTGSIVPWTLDQDAMADHYSRYRRLMAHWRAQFPDRILDVRLDELAKDPDAVLREVLAFCGLPAPDQIPAASVEAPGDWRRYEAQLAPLKERLGAMAY